MSIDILSAAVRALSFIALFQAAGAALFAFLFGDALRSSPAIARLGRWSAGAGIVLVVLHHLLDAGRMAGELAGVFEASLQYLSLTSSSAVANSLRVLGLAMLGLAMTRGTERARLLGVTGAVIACAAFLMTGHSSANDQRWLLAPLLLLHLLAVAFWFGALWPLLLVSRHEPAQLAAQVIERFSLIAAWWVPPIALAGVAMACVLLPDARALREPYGLLLVAKLLLFAVLMGLAALNKWRLGTRIAGGELKAAQAFRRSVLVEFVLICVVLVTTAVMTGFFSPER